MMWITGVAPAITMLVLMSNIQPELEDKKGVITVYVWLGEFATFTAIWLITPVYQKLVLKEPLPRVHYFTSWSSLLLMVTMFITIFPCGGLISSYHTCYPSRVLGWLAMGPTLTFVVIFFSLMVISCKLPLRGTVNYQALKLSDSEKGSLQEEIDYPLK